MPVNVFTYLQPGYSRLDGPLGNKQRVLQNHDRVSGERVHADLID